MFSSDRDFEDEVRRIARLLWPPAELGGASVRDGRERDGVFESEDFIQVVESTTSRAKQKAVDDFAKLDRLTRQLQARYPEKFIKGWLVTLHEPTADQRDVFARAKSKKVVIVSFDQFRAKLVDARSYLAARERYAFGSVRDPQTGVPRTEINYVPLDILDETGKLYTVEMLADGLVQGRRFILSGDYGAGKSATIRELHRTLAARFWKNKIQSFPLTLNLRDHHGQTDPVEAIERHARRLGFAPPGSLVRAWRAGLVALLLDGFDEVATAGWAGKTKRLRDLRYRSMELIRNFLRETPDSVGVVVAGRAHFFDSTREMESALSLGPRFELLSAREFSEQQVTDFLRKVGWDKPVPEWVPSRPLLLAYLAERNLLQQTLEVEAGSGPALGWDTLLDLISAREAEIEAGIDAGTVRRLIEHLATLARASTDGLGPLTPDQITGAFSRICGYPPDDRGAVLLQRLPGLGGHSSEDGSRVFIDNDFAEAARGGAIAAFVGDPYTEGIDPEPWQTTLQPLGAEVAALRCRRAKCSSGKIVAALRYAKEQVRSETLAADIVLMMKETGLSYDGPALYIRDVWIPELRFDEASAKLGSVEIQYSIIGVLDLTEGVQEEHLPRFVRCHFGSVRGISSQNELPSSLFLEITVDEFEGPTQTTAGLLSLSLPLGLRVLLTVLKKLFAQRGAGRKESALYRGLDNRAKQLVPAILEILRRENFAMKTRQGDETVWLPVRSSEARRRALSILAAPGISSDRLVVHARELSEP